MQFHCNNLTHVRERNFVAWNLGDISDFGSWHQGRTMFCFPCSTFLMALILFHQELIDAITWSCSVQIFFLYIYSKVLLLVMNWFAVCDWSIMWWGLNMSIPLCASFHLWPNCDWEQWSGYLYCDLLSLALSNGIGNHSGDALRLWWSHLGMWGGQFPCAVISSLRLVWPMHLTGQFNRVAWPPRLGNSSEGNRYLAGSLPSHTWHTLLNRDVS